MGWDFGAEGRDQKQGTPELTAYVESKLEGKFGLEINREKTRVVDGKKAITPEREELRKMTDVHQSRTPLPELTTRPNRQLEGWANYCGYGYRRGACACLRSRMRQYF